MADFNRTCFVCNYKLNNYNDYYFHYHDFHWDVMVDKESKAHYIKQVRDEYFIGKDAQPWEWLIGEPIVLQELRIMFGDSDSKLWASDVLREEDDAANAIIEAPSQAMITLLERLRDANFYELYNRPGIVRKRIPSPSITPPPKRRLMLITKLKDDWNGMQAKELLQPRELNTPPPRPMSPEQPAFKLIEDTRVTTELPSRINIKDYYDAVDKFDLSDSCSDFLKSLFLDIPFDLVASPNNEWEDDISDESLIQATTQAEQVTDKVVDNVINQAGGGNTEPNVSDEASPPANTIPVRFKCNSCNLVYANQKHLNTHIATKHTIYKCPNCGMDIANRIQYKIHVKNCNTLGLPLIDLHSDFFNINTIKMFKEVLYRIILEPKEETDSLDIVFGEVAQTVRSQFQNFIDNGKSFKLDIYTLVTMYKATDPSYIIQKLFKKPNGQPTVLLQTYDDIEDKMAQDALMIKGYIEKYNEMASNWILKSIDQVRYDCSENSKLVGGAGKVTLPKKIANSKCLINFELHDNNECFKYAVLMAIHHEEFQNPYRTNQYEKYFNDFDFNMEFPVSSLAIQKFEKKNPQISVFAHSYATKPECIYKTSFQSRPIVVHLACIQDHWLPITNLNAFYREMRPGEFYKCTKCIKSFFHRTSYDKHTAICTGLNIVQNESIPNPPICKFQDYDKTVDAPTVVYADIEAILEKREATHTNTQKTHLHIPCAIGAMTISRIPNCEIHEKYAEFVGEDCMTTFIDFLEELAHDVWQWAEGVETRQGAHRTAEEYKDFNAKTSCYMCLDPFKELPTGKLDKHFDHDHLTGKYRGAACGKCNMKMELMRRSVPIYFHNYRGYDNHHIVHAFSGRKDWILDPIAQNLEKFMAMQARLKVDERNGRKIYINMCFRDSFQVLPEGLATLVRDVGEASLIQTLKMADIYGISKELILAKGIFPYSFFDSFEKMTYDHLPPIEDFYDTLTDKHLDPADHQRAQQAWIEFNCRDMGEYMLRYLEMDVRQLVDVFERFRAIAKREDGLDGAHYMTVSQFAMSSALKLINKPIALCPTPEMYRLFEKSIRGGISFCNRHYIKVLNAYTTTRQLIPTEEDVTIMFVAANNLYGAALSQKLPISNFIRY